MNQPWSNHFSEASARHANAFHTQLVKHQFSLKCMYWITLKYAARLVLYFRYLCFFLYLPNVSTLYFCVQYLPQIAISSFNWLSLCRLFFFLRLDMSTAIQSNWTLSFDKNNHNVLLQQVFFMLACVHPSVHEYMSCLCFSSHISGFWAWLLRVFNGNAMQEKAMWPSWIYVHP